MSEGRAIYGDAWPACGPERPDSHAEPDDAAAAVVVSAMNAAMLAGVGRIVGTVEADPVARAVLAALRAAPPEVVAAALGWEQVGGPTTSTAGPAWTFPPHVSGGQPAFRAPAAGAGGDVGTDDEGAT